MSTSLALVSCLLLLAMPTMAFARQGDAPAVLKRAAAIAGLPDDVDVRLVDPELTGDPGVVARLDAFVLRESDGALRRVIYVNVHSPVMQRACDAPAQFLPLLAAVLHHERHHLAGATEAQARAAEREFLRALAARPSP